MDKIDRTKYLNNKSIALSHAPVSVSKFSKEQKLLFIVSFISFVILFDFTIYVFLYDTFIQSFFKSTENQFLDKINYIGLFVSSFLTRPVGGYFIGKYGDKSGRIAALKFAISIFLFTIVLTVFIPTFDKIGIIASSIIIGIRLVQGAVFGIILILLWVFIAENVPRRKLSFYIGIVFGSLTLGAAGCALFTTLLKLVMTENELVDYGWRLTYIVSAILCFIAFILSRKLEETHLFYEYKSSRGSEPNRINNRKNNRTSKCTINASNIDSTNDTNINIFNAILMTSVLSFISTNLIYLTVVLLPKLIELQFSIGASMLNTANFIGIICMVIGMVVYGWYGGKLGIGTSLIFGSFILSSSTILLFYYLTNDGGALIIPLYGILGFSSGIVSLCIVIMLQLFPIHVRLTYLGVIVNLIAAISGITLPIVLIYTTELVSFSPAIYYIFIGICTFILGIHTSSNLVINELKHIVD